MQLSGPQKVVLARVCELRFRQFINVDGGLDYRNQNYVDCYRYLLEPHVTHDFYGSTPQLHVHGSGDQVRTMALAGSIRRGKTAEEDAELGEQLLNDPKEQHEHALVANAIREKLGALTSELSVPDAPEIYRLRNIQHLHTPIIGTL